MHKYDALKRMLEIAVEAKKGGDREALHGEADDILCEFLRSIGHSDLADAFEDAAQDFWYA